MTTGEFYIDSLEDIYDFPCAQPLGGFSLSGNVIESSEPSSMETTTSSLSDSEESQEVSPRTIHPSVDSLGLSEPSISSRVLRGKNFLLTWSQSPNLSREMIRDHLMGIASVSSLAIGKESHSDAGVHFHAMVIFQKMIQKSPKSFSILGRPANVKIPDRRVGSISQSVVNMWNYVLKEDPTPILIGTPPTTSLKRNRDELRNQVFKTAFDLATTESVESAMKHLCTESPFDLLTRYDTIERGLTVHRARVMRLKTAVRPMTDFPFAPSVPDGWKNLFLTGSTGLGKTQFAKALLPDATIVSHTDQLRTVDFSKGIIFDDFAISHWPPASAIHLLDWDEPRGINVKHGHVVIPPHTRKIFTFNDHFASWCPKDASNDQLSAMRRRIEVIDIFNKLF